MIDWAELMEITDRLKWSLSINILIYKLRTCFIRLIHTLIMEIVKINYIRESSTISIHVCNNPEILTIITLSSSTFLLSSLNWEPLEKNRSRVDWPAIWYFTCKDKSLIITHVLMLCYEMRSYRCFGIIPF